MSIFAGPEPEAIPLVIPQGTTFRVRFQWIAGAQIQSLEGYSAVFSVARRAGRPPTFAVTSQDGDIELEPLDDQGLPQGGVIVVTVPADKTVLLTRPSVYDLVLIDDGGDVMRLFEGVVTVDRGVTLPGGSA